jgi:hypothetical protein
MQRITLFHKSVLANVLLLLSLFSNAQQDILKIAASTNKLTGKVEVFYPDNFKEQAIYTQSMMEKAVAFYKATLGIDISVSIVMFGPKEYNQFTLEKWKMAGKYNQFLPFTAIGSPAVICLPIAEGSALENNVQSDIKENTDYNLTAAQIRNRLITTIGFHELGHVVLHEMEIEQEVGWYNEFIANYIGYAFISQLPKKEKKDPGKAALNEVNKPIDKHFGGMFKGSSDSYIWWQSSLQRRVDEMFPKPGLSFIFQLANLRNNVQYFDDLSILVAMEQISPGFLNWAKREGHINEQDEPKIAAIEKKIKNQVNEAIKGRSQLYTSSYSSQWTNGDSINTRIVMKFMESWEKNAIDTSLLSPWVYYKYNWENKQSFFDKLKTDRDKFAKCKIKLSSIIPVKTTDRNEDWVVVYAGVDYTDLNGNLSTTNFTQWYKINKDKKIEFFKEFDE